MINRMKRKTLYKFFEGTATLEEEMSVREWMEHSERNKKEFFRERVLFDASLVLPNPELAYTQRKPSGRIRLLREVIKIASVVLLTLALGTAYQTYQSARQPIVTQSITVPAGQYINLTLPDGTAVWLNARTTLTYPVNFNKNQRTIELNGEAYFEVARKKSSPFIVKTDKHLVEVLGTKFNVESYNDNMNFSTTLMEGRVKIISKENPKVSLLLKPDTKAVYENGELIVQKVDDYNPYRWKEGLICFRNESFGSIMRHFEKYYGVTIRINNTSVNTHNYTGKFRQKDGVDYALRVLQRDIDFRFNKNDEEQEITIE